VVVGMLDLADLSAGDHARAAAIAVSVRAVTAVGSGAQLLGRGFALLRNLRPSSSRSE
jgi:hypothetical protein